MRLLIFVPVKPAVLVWTLLSGMILVGFITSLVTQAKDPSALGGPATQQSRVKAAVHGVQQSSRTRETSHR